MRLSWNEIESGALQFTQEWKDEVSEEAETKPFLEAFFHEFGIRSQRNAAGISKGYGIR